MTNFQFNSYLIQQMVKQDKMIFTAADVDKNGVLSRGEYQSFSAPEEHPQMFPILVKQVLDEKDTDKDGMLSFQEFMGDRGQKHNRQVGTFSLLWLEMLLVVN